MPAEKEFAVPHFQDSTAGEPAGRSTVARELREETGRLRRLHALLGAELEAATARAGGALAAPTGEELSARYERDVSVHRWSDRVSALTAARSGLCFGRLDHAAGTGHPGLPDHSAPVTGDVTYVGRIGLTEPTDGESALTDWRAPASRPFYCATLATPLGVRRRRHFEIAGTAPDERVAAFHDDVLDGDSDSGSAADPALLAALKAPRGSTMRDIVGTIQAEQDSIIRLPLAGAAVIEGGPGTGKTAVALHRVAYLLYTHRDRLARSGVLVVGPSAGFVRYVGGVLPALGESAVVFTTPGRLANGVVATAVDPPEVARTKGDLSMVDVLRRAVAALQRLPSTPIAIALEDVTVEVDRAAAATARRRARASGLPHNAARRIFRDVLGGLLVDRGLTVLDRGLADPPELAELLRELDLPDIEPAGAAEVSAQMRAELRDDLRANLDFHAAVEELWPVRTPQETLAALYASPEELASAGGAAHLHRATGPWTVADAPLLDELAELLGALPAARPGEQREPDSRYAAEVLAVLEAADRQLAGEDPDELRPTDFVTADVLAARQVPGHLASVAERAATDRDWRYGHLVVDEAQELSAMDWHVLLRRCPSRSVTAVGDLAQRSAPAGALAWADVLGPHLGDRWTHRTLTVNYRTPSEIMVPAAEVLADFAPGHRAPESVRSTGEDPWHRTVPAAELVAEVRAVVAAHAAHAAPPGGPAAGTLAVIVPQEDVPADNVPAENVPGLADLTARLPDLLADLPAELHTPVSAKGLEFDVVVIVDPERIRARHPADLYVSMTRATQRLGLLHVAR